MKRNTWLLIPYCLIQPRMTCLHHATLRGKAVETVTPTKKKVKRWFYINIRKSLDPAVDREDALEFLKIELSELTLDAMRF